MRLGRRSGLTRLPLPVAILMVLATFAGAQICASAPWPRHTIDDSSHGADGVRLADANGDGLLDIATAWEEGGEVRVYLNPGPERVSMPWPRVTVGKVGSPEDAVLVDLDDDGAMDVVSCSEGQVRAVSVHWAPQRPEVYLDPAAWRTEAIPASVDLMQWMFCWPVEADAGSRLGLVCGGKSEGAQIGWFVSPAEPRNLAGWSWRPFRQAGWIMSIRPFDMDSDGISEILFSDRRGDKRGCFWLSSPATLGGDREKQPFCHVIGSGNHEVMFLTAARRADGGTNIAAATSDNGILLFESPAEAGGSLTWSSSVIPMPENAGTGKGVAFGDVDRDGQADIVFSCENADGKSGVMWLSQTATGKWIPHDISGDEGIKFDLVELIDLDTDGDLDVLTCEERTGLGVMWYENPHGQQ